MKKTIQKKTCILLIFFIASITLAAGCGSIENRLTTVIITETQGDLVSYATHEAGSGDTIRLKTFAITATIEDVRDDAVLVKFEVEQQKDSIWYEEEWTANIQYGEPYSMPIPSTLCRHVVWELVFER